MLLWCFEEAGLLPAEWEAFTPTINEQLIKSVLLQERAVKRNYWESGQLALRYKMVGDVIKHAYEIEIVVVEQDIEFELVFVIAYQKMLNLHYLDKLLNEIQFRWGNIMNKLR